MRKGTTYSPIHQELFSPSLRRQIMLPPKNPPTFPLDIYISTFDGPKIRKKGRFFKKIGFFRKILIAWIIETLKRLMIRLLAWTLSLA